MYYLIIFSSLITGFIFGFLVRFYVKRKKKNKYSSQNEIDAKEISSWKKDRRKNNSPISLNVRAMGNNIEKSHDLWKALSKMVHESRWIGESSEKIKLAAELNSLINENKGNFMELQNIQLRIEKELLNNN